MNKTFDPGIYNRLDSVSIRIHSSLWLGEQPENKPHINARADPSTIGNDPMRTTFLCR
ncbi:MAG: hypothetical protein ACKN85_15650 [Pirellula sp.]